MTVVDVIWKSGYPGGITVLMSVYARDNPSLFRRAIASVYANSVLPDDFVLVVDGPVPDELGKVIAEINEQYPLRIHHLPRNGGLRNALNSALALINTTWVARADADDINHAERFAVQLAAIEAFDGELDLVGSAIQEADHDGTPIAVRRMPVKQVDILKFAKRRNPFNHMTVIFRLVLALECGGYPSLHLREDYGLWALMLAKGAKALNIPEVLVTATTGKEFYVRRGGLRSALAEYDLQKLLCKAKIKSIWLAGFDCMVRSAVFIMPPMFRQYIYSKFLRT